MFCPRCLSGETKCFLEKNNKHVKQKCSFVAFYKMHLCPDYRNLLSLWVALLYLAANFRGLHDHASLGKCGRKSSVHTQQKRNCWLGGFAGLPTPWGEPGWTSTLASVAAMVLLQCVCVCV